MADRALLVEDDPQIAKAIANRLQVEGFTVRTERDEAGLAAALADADATPAIVVLDRLLDRYDTKEALPRLRAVWPASAVLVVSAINSPLEKAALLELGADDYLGKPFLGEELTARIRALRRRALPPAPERREIGNTILHFDRSAFSVDGACEVLAPKAFLLLRTLARDPGRIFNRDALLDAVWGEESNPDSNVLEATLTHLRRRLEARGSSIRLRNLRHAGYFVEV